MVKSRTISAITILVLMCSLSIISLSQSKIEQISTPPSYNVVYRPVFAGGEEDNTTVLVTRNDVVHNGSILKAEVPIYSNLSFWYKFNGGDNESAPLLFGDDGTNTPNSLSWDDPTLMTYDNESTVELGVGIYAYYNYTFNLSSSFVSFYARYGEYEDPFKVPNIITTGVWIESYFVQDVFTQYEDIELDIILHDYNISQYGLMYREVESTHSLPFQNVTFALDDEGAQRNVTASFSHSFEAGTQIEVRSFIVQYDSVTQQNRIFQENKARLITLSDGNPELSLETKRYTNSRTVELKWSADAINSNITGLDIDWDDGAGVEAANVSLSKVIHEYTSSGEYEIVATAYSFFGLGEVTETITVLIETEEPTGTIFILESNGNIIQPNETEVVDIEVEKKELRFNVSGEDTGGSGLMKLIVETDEGNIVESPSAAVIVVPFLDYGFHVITFKAEDFAGNVYSFVIYVNLIEKELPTYAPIPFPFGIVTIIGLLSIALIYIKKRK